jgi:hypothetical protein
MPVLINEFEVIGEAPPPPPANASDAGGDRPKKKLEPAELQAPLHFLHQEKLRTWAH